MKPKEQAIRSTILKARGMLPDDPQGARRLAEAVSADVEELPEVAGEVLGLLAAARHYCGDREGAHAAFRLASQAESSSLLKGRLYCQWALLELDRHHHDEALRRVNEGVSLVEGTDPSDRDLAQVLLARGIVLRHLEQYDNAERDYRRALRLIHPRKDPDLHFKATQNLGMALLSGAKEPRRVRRALKTLDEANKLLRRYRIRLKSVPNASVLWMRGLAYRMAGLDERAETLLLRARQILFDLGAMMDWTRLSLDLIEIYMHYGRWGTVKRTLGEILDHAHDAEVLVAVAVFYDAIREDAVNVTEDVLRDVYAKVHGGNRQPPALALDEMADDSEPIGF